VRRPSARNELVTSIGRRKCQRFLDQSKKRANHSDSVAVADDRKKNELKEKEGRNIESKSTPRFLVKNEPVRGQDEKEQVTGPARLKRAEINPGRQKNRAAPQMKLGQETRQEKEKKDHASHGQAIVWKVQEHGKGATRPKERASRIMPVAEKACISRGEKSKRW